MRELIAIGLIFLVAVGTIFLLSMNSFQASTQASLDSESQASTEQAGGDPVWDANTVLLESKQLANGVYAVYQKDAEAMVAVGIPLATSGGFIVGEDSVVVIDTMMTKRLTNQVLAMIKSVTNKPIRYAINTSFHGDHSYGNHLLPADTIVIQHAHAKHYVDNFFEEDIEFMIGNFGTGRNIEDAVPRTGDILIPEGGELLLDLGDRQVLIKDFGFAQTGGDLFIYLQDERVLWTGNPIISSAPSLPWLLDGHLIATLETLKAVYDFLPVDVRVVPGHGAVTNRAAIQWNIDYLQAVHDGVKQAIAEGKTLDETIAALPMEEFRGYGLFDWVHPGLNIPAAYQDLSAE